MDEPEPILRTSKERIRGGFEPRIVGLSSPDDSPE
jgi:hypothetical protein